jgi:hypothetical protein
MRGPIRHRAAGASEQPAEPGALKGGMGSQCTCAAEATAVHEASDTARSGGAGSLPRFSPAFTQVYRKRSERQKVRKP